MTLPREVIPDRRCGPAAASSSRTSSTAGFRELLLRLLRHRFGDEVDTHIEQRVAAAPIEQIEAWSVRVLSATTLTELLAD